MRDAAVGCVYISSFVNKNMSSALIWSIESVVLGLWALVFAQYSTPLHVFIARSHVLISSFTALLHLVIISRDLVVGSAVSQAFLCAVSALFLVYMAAILTVDADGKPPAVYFTMPSVGLLTLDAVIGLAWFCMAMLSGLGMALSFVKPATGDIKAKKTLLMFNRYGVHLVVVFPCLVLVPSTLVYFSVIVWLIHLVYMAVTVGGVDITSIVLKQGEDFQSMRWYQMALFGVLYVFHMIFRFASIFILLMVLFIVRLNPYQLILLFCLFGVAGATSLDVILSPLIFSLGCVSPLKLRAIDKFFSREWDNEEVPKIQEPMDVPSAPPATSMASMMRFPSSSLPRYQLLVDPAAVSMQREKMG